MVGENKWTPNSSKKKEITPVSCRWLEERAGCPALVRLRGAFLAAFLKKLARLRLLSHVGQSHLEQRPVPDKYLSPANCFLAWSSCRSSWPEWMLARDWERSHFVKILEFCGKLIRIFIQACLWILAQRFGVLYLPLAWIANSKLQKFHPGEIFLQRWKSSLSNSLLQSETGIMR